MHQLGRADSCLYEIAVSPTIVDPYVMAIPPAYLLKCVLKGRNAGLCLRIALRPVHQHGNAVHPVGLLPTRGERPRGRRPAEKRDELAPFHSITSSARASSVGGTVSPRALAVLRLMTSSNFVGCTTGRSAGLAPFRIRSTRYAARRNRSASF